MNYVFRFPAYDDSESRDPDEQLPDAIVAAMTIYTLLKTPPSLGGLSLENREMDLDGASELADALRKAVVNLGGGRYKYRGEQVEVVLQAPAKDIIDQLMKRAPQILGTAGVQELMATRRYLRDEVEELEPDAGAKED